MQVLPRAAQAARRACLLCVLSPPRCDGGDLTRRDYRLSRPARFGVPEVDYPTIQVVTLYPGASPMS